MLVNAGIMKADGTVLKKDKDIRGGEIVMGADGTPTGFLKEQAGTYTRSFLDTERLYPVNVAKIVIRLGQLFLQRQFLQGCPANGSGRQDELRDGSDL